jgi:hypothetical protein
MNYQAIYNQLIERARNRTLDQYSERHHVVPSCMQGSDDATNIVRLTPEEHFVAHQLLVKIYPDSFGLVLAALRMADGTKYVKRTNKQFGWLKRRRSEMMSGDNHYLRKDPIARAKNQVYMRSADNPAGSFHEKVKRIISSGSLCRLHFQAKR